MRLFLVRFVIVLFRDLDLDLALGVGFGDLLILLFDLGSDICLVFQGRIVVHYVFKLVLLHILAQSEIAKLVFGGVQASPDGVRTRLTKHALLGCFLSYFEQWPFRLLLSNRRDVLHAGVVEKLFHFLWHVSLEGNQYVLVLNIELAQLEV